MNNKIMVSPNNVYINVNARTSAIHKILNNSVLLVSKMKLVQGTLIFTCVVFLSSISKYDIIYKNAILNFIISINFGNFQHGFPLVFVHSIRAFLLHFKYHEYFNLN